MIDMKYDSDEINIFKFQDKAYEYWRRGCDLGATEPHARACFSAALLDTLEQNSKIDGLAGQKSEVSIERKQPPDPIAVRP